jgi:hypothetical protein
MSNSKYFTDFIKGSGFFLLNKDLADEIGLDATMLLTDLVSKQDYFNDRGMTTDGWFFNTVENLTKDTRLSHHRQVRATKILQTLEILEKKRKGVPPKQWFRINHTALKAFIDTIIKNLIFINENINVNKSKYQSTTNNKNNYNKNNSKVSKEKILDTNRDLLKSLDTSYLKRWNSLKAISPTIPKHRLFTKTHQTINDYCTLLTKGKLFTKNRLDKEWMKKNNIPIDIETKKWVNKEIYLAFRLLAFSFTKDYPPYDKKYLNRSLPVLLYNPNSNKSWFLAVYYNPPVKFSEQINDKYPQFTEMFLPLFNGNLNPQDKKKLAWGVKSIIFFHPRLSLDIGIVKSRLRRPRDLCREFIKYLEEEVDRVYPGMVSATSKTWNNFIDHTEYILDLKYYGKTLVKGG